MCGFLGHSVHCGRMRSRFRGGVFLRRWHTNAKLVTNRRWVEGIAVPRRPRCERKSGSRRMPCGRDCECTARTSYCWSRRLGVNASRSSSGKPEHKIARTGLFSRTCRFVWVHFCKAHFKQSSNAPLLHYRAGVKSFQLPRECLDGRRQSGLCW